MKLFIFFIFPLILFSHEPQPFVPCTSATLIFSHDFTSHMLSPEWDKQQEARDKIIKEEFRKAAEIQKNEKEKESLMNQSNESLKKDPQVLVLSSPSKIKVIVSVPPGLFKSNP